MAINKVITTLCVTTFLFLLLSTACYGRRLAVESEPASNTPAADLSFSNKPIIAGHEFADIDDDKFRDDDDICSGPGDDDCIIKRTLAAQIDYIYTQKNHP